ncbi:hypothetical protein T06_6822 [Trichinella sp. T6]|nr:hypothetical protein T06_6822 [Trichinella sp. T6]
MRTGRQQQQQQQALKSAQAKNRKVLLSFCNVKEQQQQQQQQQQQNMLEQFTLGATRLQSTINFGKLSPAMCAKSPQRLQLCFAYASSM